MKIKKLLFVLLAVLLVFSLFGCGKKGSSDIVDNPDDVTLVIEEPDLDDIKADKNTIEIDGKQYEITDTGHSDVPQKTEVLLTTEELHALFKKEYDHQIWSKENLGEYYESMRLNLPAREIGTKEDANVYSRIEKDMAEPEYEGKILPDDGFEQYVAWREALEKGSSGGSSQSGNSQSGNNSGNTSNSGNTGGQTQQKPSGGNGNSGNSGGSSGNSNGSSGSAGSSSGGESGNVYEDAHITNTVPDNGDFGEQSTEKEYEKPSYEIIG